ICLFKQAISFFNHFFNIHYLLPPRNSANCCDKVSNERPSSDVVSSGSVFVSVSLSLGVSSLEVSSSSEVLSLDVSPLLDSSSLVSPFCFPGTSSGCEPSYFAVLPDCDSGSFVTLPFSSVAGTFVSWLYETLSSISLSPAYLPVSSSSLITLCPSPTSPASFPCCLEVCCPVA